MSRQIPWLRVFVEGVVIVASILLAFGIDAWWDERQEREAESQALAGLESEFAINLGQVRVQVANHEANQRLLTSLEALPDSELEAVPNEDIGRYEAALMSRFTFDPSNGTLDALIASGSLDIIRAMSLRNALVSWSALIEDSEEEAGDHRSAANRVRRRVFQMGGPWRNLGPSARRRAPAADLVTFANDSELMARNREHLAASERYTAELTRIEQLATDILELIRSQLPRAPLASIATSPGPGMTQPRPGAIGGFRATATLLDGSTRIVTDLARWSSSNTTILHLDDFIGRAERVGVSEVCASLEGADGCVSIAVSP